MKPWRNVISTRRGERSDTGLPTVIQRLDCGHEFTFVGQAAIKAREAERRMCCQCPDVPKLPAVKRQSAKRSYILIRDADF
jgi:hypothetical protein